MTAVAQEQRVTCQQCGQAYRIPPVSRPKKYAFRCRKCGNPVIGTLVDGGALKAQGSPAQPLSNGARVSSRERNHRDASSGAETARSSRHLITCSGCGRVIKIAVPAGRTGVRLTCPGCKTEQRVQLGQGSQTLSPRASSGDKKVWFVKRPSGKDPEKTYGPFSAHQLSNLIRRGKVKSYDLVSNNRGEWKAANSVPQFVDTFLEPRKNQGTPAPPQPAGERESNDDTQGDSSQPELTRNQWYISKPARSGTDSEVFGPLTEEMMCDRILSRQLRSYDRIKLGNGDWMQANEAPEFSAAFKEVSARKKSQGSGSDGAQRDHAPVPPPKNREYYYIWTDGILLGPMSERDAHKAVKMEADEAKDMRAIGPFSQDELLALGIPETSLEHPVMSFRSTPPEGELREIDGQAEIPRSEMQRKNPKVWKQARNFLFLAELFPNPVEDEGAQPVDSTGFYRVLGVGQNASQEEIKKAYYKQVRRHPPEKDPEGFKAIKGAYDVLADSRSRKKYDAIRRYGTEISDLFSQADTCMADEKWDEASRLLKRLLALAPEEDTARNMLGLCYLNGKRIQEAISVYDQLTQSEPEIAVYWMNFGHANVLKSDDESVPETVRKTHLAKARSCFARVIELEPYNAAPYIETARICSNQGDHNQALEYLERSVDADGTVDFSDLEALLFMCIVYMRMERYSDIDRTARRIREIVPDEEDARKYVAARFAVIAGELVKVQAFTDAHSFIKAAVNIDPANMEMSDYCTAIGSMAAASQDWDKLKDDSLVVMPLRMISLIFLCDAAGEELPDRENKFREWINALDHENMHKIISSIQRIKKTYRNLYNLNQEFFDRLKDVASGGAPQQNANSGCFIATAAFGSPDEPIITVYRVFRDTVLKPSKVGRLGIRVYEIIGPPAAALIKRCPKLKRPISQILAAIAPLIERLCMPTMTR